MSWVIVVALAGAALAGYLWSRRRGRLPATLVVVAVLTIVGGSVVTARMVATVEDAGADIDLVDTFDVWSKQTAAPDADATYALFKGGAGDGEPLQLSIYRPPDADSAPVLVFIHGGGFVAGSRDVHGPDFRWFADRGWLTISVDYPLSSADQHLWDGVEQQIGCALAWVGTNAPQYGGDPTRLSLSGDSAGGNLAINVAYMAANGTLKSSCGGPRPVVSAVSALYPVVDVAGFYDNADLALGDVSRDMAGAYVGGSPREFPQRYAAVASATHISPAAPPDADPDGRGRPPRPDRGNLPIRRPGAGGRRRRRTGGGAVRGSRVRRTVGQHRPAGLPATDREMAARSWPGAVTTGLLSGS